MTSFLDFVDENQLKISEQTIYQVRNDCQELKEVAKSSGGKGKQVPYASTKKGKTLRGKPYQKLKEIPANEQRYKMEKLWEEMETNKMDIEEGSKWYLISTVWFNQWKEWTGFTTSTKSTDGDTTNEGLEADNQHKSKVEEPGRLDNQELINPDEIMLFREINLKDNLNEEEDYIIVNRKIWTYLYSIYDGIPILRHAIKNFDNIEQADMAETIIEVNLIKFYVFEVPREHKQDYYEVVLASRNSDMREVKLKI